MKTSILATRHITGDVSRTYRLRSTFKVSCEKVAQSLHSAEGAREQMNVNF